MLHLTTLLLGSSAGIAGYAGVTHLLIGAARRPRDWTQLLFGFLSLAVAVHTLVVLGLHTATSIAGYIVLLKYGFGLSTFVVIVTLVWFVALYTGGQPRRFLLAMSLWYVLIIALHLSLPFGIQYADISGLRPIRLPWGEQVVVASGAPHPLQLVNQLFFLTMFGFFGYALVRQYRRGSAHRALVLGLALFLFLIARVIDPLVLLGAIDSLLTSEFAFLGIVVAMSLVLSHGVTQTEIELQSYQQDLHALVAARTAALTRANARLTTLYQASQAINQTSLDPERIYAELHTAIVRLMPVEAFAITLIDDAQHEADDVYLADAAGRRTGERYPLAQTFAGALLGRNASLRIDDFSAFPQHVLDTESGVAALLRGSERVLGLVVVQSYMKSAYGDADEEALNLLAVHAAVSLENAQRYHQARELATSAERTRLARELHDAVTQTLYSASLLAEAMPMIWRRDIAVAERNMMILRQLVRGAMAEMRTLLFELRPAALVAADLSTLLKQLADRLTGNSRVPVALTVDGEAQLPPDIKIAIYRIAQEAFNNIAKHANATQVWVTLRAEPSQLFLSVRDDGCGFDPSRVAADHLGTRIMAERAAGIGTQLRIDSAPRQGTEVSLSWPDLQR